MALTSRGEKALRVQGARQARTSRARSGIGGRLRRPRDFRLRFCDWNPRPRLTARPSNRAAMPTCIVAANIARPHLISSQRKIQRVDIATNLRRVSAS